MNGKVTMYHQGMLGVVKTEATQFGVEVKPYAQYAQAVHVEFVPKGKRKPRVFVQSYKPTLLVLSGWGHPDPDGTFLPETPGSSEGITLARSRYSACDPRWQSDFDQKIEGYLKMSGAQVLHDFRQHNLA